MAFLKKTWGLVMSRKVFWGGSAVLATTTGLSYIFGLLRDRLLAQHFGASQILGAYEAAFIVPDLILNIFVAGALTAAFVPIFNSFLESGLDKEESDEFASSVLNGSLFMVLIAGVLVFIFAPWLSKIIVPGFQGQVRESFINLMRLLLLSPIIFAVSNTFGNILVSREKFFWYGASPSLYNIGTILGTLLLATRFGIMGVALGTLAGALLHLISRIIGLRRYFFKYKFGVSFNQYYKKFLALMIPKMIQHPIEELTFWGFTAIASALTAGSIVVLNFARNFESMPVNTIGLTFALAVFPAMSRAAASDDKSLFLDQMFLAVKSILALSIPIAILMFLLKLPIISIIFGGGAFDRNAIILTAQTLGFFTLAIPTESLTQILARSFYALKNSLTPVLVSIVGLGVAIACGYLFSRTLGVKGLALGFFAGSLTKIILLSFLLKIELSKKFVTDLH